MPLKQGSRTGVLETRVFGPVSLRQAFSDGAHGTAVLVLVSFTEAHLARWGLSYDALQAGWQPIALCEAAMIPIALREWPERFRGRSIVWYVASTAAMSAFAKGASANQHLDAIVGLCWIIAFHLDCRLGSEWVDSGANWLDDMSRLFDADPLSRELGFEPCELNFDASWWSDDPVRHDEAIDGVHPYVAPGQASAESPGWPAAASFPGSGQ